MQRFSDEVLLLVVIIETCLLWFFDYHSVEKEFHEFIRTINWSLIITGCILYLINYRGRSNHEIIETGG